MRASTVTGAVKLCLLMNYFAPPPPTSAPSLTVYLAQDVATDQEHAKDIQSTLEHTTLEKVTSFTQIYYDPDAQQTVVGRDEEYSIFYFSIQNIIKL